MNKTATSIMLMIFTSILANWSVNAQINHLESTELTLEDIMIGGHRSPENISRNNSRNPAETLEFFGLKPDMTLIEIGPSGAWYTEILAPYMRDHGRYYGAHFSPNSTNTFQRRNLENFEAKLTANPKLYGKAVIRHLHPPH